VKATAPSGFSRTLKMALLTPIPSVKRLIWLRSSPSWEGFFGGRLRQHGQPPAGAGDARPIARYRGKIRKSCLRDHGQHDQGDHNATKAGEKTSFSELDKQEGLVLQVGTTGPRRSFYFTSDKATHLDGPITKREVESLGTACNIFHEISRGIF